jgi:hypothetical protein
MIEDFDRVKRLYRDIGSVLSENVQREIAHWNRRR